MATRGAATVPGKQDRKSAASSLSLTDRVWMARVRAEIMRGNYDAAYLRARRGQKRHPMDALRKAASNLLLREAVESHLAAGVRLRQAGRLWQAALQFRTALALDPANYDARQALEADMPDLQPPAGRFRLNVQQAAPLPALHFVAGRHAFQFDGTTWNLLHVVARAYGLRAFIDKKLPNSPVRFRLGPAALGQCLIALRDQLGVAWNALGPHTIFFGPAADQAKFTPIGLRTFYLARGLDQPQRLQEIAQALRLMLDLRWIQLDPARGAIVCRGTAAQLDAAEQLLANLSRPGGQVMLDVRIVEVTHSVATQIGVNPHTQFQVFSLAPLLAGLGQSGNLQSLIQQLFSQGGLNGILSSGQLSQELQQLQQQLSPLLNTPFAVFGGGATLMAVTWPPTVANFSFQHGRSRTLETAWLRANSSQQATLRIGERYPVVNASFAPIYLNSAVQQVLGNKSYIQPFPSFTFVNLGLNLKLKPVVESKGRVQVSIQARVRSLTGQYSNNIPVLSDRSLTTHLSLREGKPAVIAGLFTHQEMQSLAGVPGIARLPVIGRLFSSLQNQNSDDQLLVFITPHILASNDRRGRDIWLPPGFNGGQQAAGYYAPAYPRPPIYRPPGAPPPGLPPFGLPSRPPITPRSNPPHNSLPR